MTFVKTALFHKAGEGSGGGGGGDQHNLGWYATESALTTAHATATDGDWAIVGATDTVWVWDSDTTAWKDTGQAGIELPDQTGNAGKFLTTNGSSASWSDKPLVNKATGTNSFVIGNTNHSGGTRATSVGDYATAYDNATSVGSGAWAAQRSLAIGVFSGGLSYVSDYISIGYYAQCYANYAIQLGRGTNTTAGTMSVGLSTDGNTWNNYELLSSDGTIPEARLADTTNAQQGDVLTLDANGDAVWQAGGSGGLQNTATGTYSLTIIGNASTAWGSVNVGDNSTATGGEALVAIGKNASATGTNNGGGGIAIGFNSVSVSYKVNFYQAGIAIGAMAEARTPYPSDNTDKTGTLAIGTGAVANKGGGIAIGDYAKASGVHAIQLGCMGNGNVCNNSDDNTFKVANHNGNFEMMSANGTIPTARLTKVNSTITLTASGWSNGSQTVTVTGMTATGVVLVSPDPTDQSAYTSAGIICTAQAADSLTFTCSTTPSADIDVNVVML